MNAPGNDPAPGSRRRRRRIVVTLAVVAVVIAAIALSSARSGVALRARAIQVGQPRDEVIRLMGQPQIMYTAGTGVAGECYTDMSSLELTVRSLIYQISGISTFPAPGAYPVDIQYDDNRRVSRVRINGEVIDKQEMP